MPEYDKPEGQVSGGDAVRIVNDIAAGVPPEQSSVKYGPAEHAYRARVEAWWEQKKREDPQAAIDVRE